MGVVDEGLVGVVDVLGSLGAQQQAGARDLAEADRRSEIRFGAECWRQNNQDVGRAEEQTETEACRFTIQHETK